MIYIEDDFYPKPDQVREQALKEFFYPGRKGSRRMFPGVRTRGKITNENFIYVKNRLEKIIGKRIIDFPFNNSNTAFTLGKKEKVSLVNWVHHDCSQITEKLKNSLDGEAWASICYLSPNAKVTHGTGLFMSDKTGKIYKNEEHSYAIGGGFKDFWEYGKAPEGEDFKLHSYISNIYNRLVIYPADYWHAPFNAGWGHDKETGRLVQVCFFVTER